MSAGFLSYLQYGSCIVLRKVRFVPLMAFLVVFSCA